MSPRHDCRRNDGYFVAIPDFERIQHVARASAGHLKDRNWPYLECRSKSSNPPAKAAELHEKIQELRVPAYHRMQTLNAIHEHCHKSASGVQYVCRQFEGTNMESSKATGQPPIKNSNPIPRHPQLTMACWKAKLTVSSRISRSRSISVRRIIRECESAANGTWRCGSVHARRVCSASTITQGFAPTKPSTPHSRVRDP